MDNTEELIEMHEALFEYMMSHSGCGASDTEPREVLFKTLENVIDSKSYKVPGNPSDRYKSLSRRRIGFKFVLIF